MLFTLLLVGKYLVIQGHKSNINIKHKLLFNKTSMKYKTISKDLILKLTRNLLQCSNKYFDFNTEKENLKIYIKRII